MLHLLAIIVSFFITFKAIPIVITVAKQKKLIDSPGDRKIHTSPVPSLGGIGVFVGFMLTSCLFWPWESQDQGGELASVVAASLLIFFLGVKDDTIGVSPSKKFLMQVFASAVVVIKHGLIIFSFHSLFGLYTVPSALTFLTTVLTIILIINAYNLIDGIDGLSGMLGCFSMAAFGIFFFFSGDYGFSIFSASMIGSLCAFLYFNKYPARIFMGDTGSLLLGLINAILALKFMVIAADGQNFFLEASHGPIIAMAILFVPLFDALRVFTIRILKGKSPFAAEKNHIHHYLLNKGLSHTQAGITIVTFNAMIVLLMWIFKDTFSSTTLFFMMVSIGSLATWIAYSPEKSQAYSFPVSDSLKPEVSILKESDQAPITKPLTASQIKAAHQE